MKKSLGIKLEEKDDAVYLHINISPNQNKATTQFATTQLLGKAQVPNVPLENPDGSSLVIDTDYFGNKRSLKKPSSGPFENSGSGRMKLTVWPKN